MFKKILFVLIIIIHQTNAINLYRGEHYYGGSQPTHKRVFSEAVKSDKEILDVCNIFQNNALCSDMIKGRLMPRGRSYEFTTPCMYALSSYVAYYDHFLKKIHTSGLSSYSFKIEEDSQYNYKQMFVSFSKAIETPTKYAYGITNDNWGNTISVPFYNEQGKPSTKDPIGKIIIAHQCQKTKNTIYVDIEKEIEEGQLILGKTKARRLGQQEICVIGGIHSSVRLMHVDVNLPDFCNEWVNDGTNSNLQKVDSLGFTKRHFYARKRELKNSDDQEKSHKHNYEKLCKSYIKHKNMDYVISKAINSFKYPAKNIH